jgi:hypothetical protein
MFLNPVIHHSRVRERHISSTVSNKQPLTARTAFYIGTVTQKR